MKLLFKLFRKIGALLIAGAAAPSWAGPLDLVSLTGEVGFSCFTGTGGFEQYCSTGENVERGTFSLVYDRSIADSDPDEHRGLFRGAILSFEMAVSQINRPDLSFSLLGRGDFHREFFPTTGLGDWISWTMQLEEQNNVFAPSSFSFGMYRQASWANPNQMPNGDIWSEMIGYGGGGAGVHETDWLNSRISASDHVPVSVPPPLWLLLIGTAAAFLHGRGGRKARHGFAGAANHALPAFQTSRQ